MRLFFSFVFLLMVGCGSASTLGGHCTTACDCTDSSKPLSCATGEWTCNDNSTCEFKCQSSCGGGGVGTCSFPGNCDTTKMQCSERGSCH